MDDLTAIAVNGTTQWISVRGRDQRNPILLFLHGGPGSPTMPADYTFQNPWEDYFTVVQWDQRGTGKTFVANDPKIIAPTMTVQQMTSDAEEVVRYLLKDLRKAKDNRVVRTFLGNGTGCGVGARNILIGCMRMWA